MFFKWVRICLVLLTGVVGLSCATPEDRRPPDEVRSAITSEELESARLHSVREDCYLVGAAPAKVEGYGLIVELPGTGSRTAPREIRTYVRRQLLKDNIKNIDSLISSRNTAIAHLSAELPPLVRPGDKVDVKVEAIGDARDINHGLLLPTPLKRVVVQGGRKRLGLPVASAGGYITTRVLQTDGALMRQDPLVGVITDGATSESTGRLLLALKRPSTIAALRIENCINNVFPAAATASTRRSVTVNIPNHYRDDIKRFFQVLESIDLSPSHDSAHEKEISRLAKRLKEGDPEEKWKASCSLEAYGVKALPYLREIAREPLPRDSRILALAALSHLDDRESLPIFNLLARSNNSEERLAVARYVGNIRSPIAIEILQSLLSDSDPDVAYRACVSLLKEGQVAPVRLRKGRSLSLVTARIEAPRKTAVFIKTTSPRSITILGGRVRLRPPFRISAFDIELLGKQNNPLEIHYTVEGKRLKQVISLSLEDTISALDAIGVPYNEIAYFVESLYKKGCFQATVEYVDF